MEPLLKGTSMHYFLQDLPASSNFVNAAPVDFDDQGRPVLPGRLEFDLNLMNNDLVMATVTKEEGNEEIMDPSTLAHQGTLNIKGEETDLSESFVNPLPESFIHGGMSCAVTANDGDDGDEIKTEDGASSDEQQHGQEQETGGNESEGGGAQETAHHGGASTQYSATMTAVMEAASDPFTTQYQFLHAVDQQHVNGANDANATASGAPACISLPSAESQVVKDPVHVSGRSHMQMQPDVARHVEEAIERVVQRAREGPLEMPAFRTPAEKSAAAQAHAVQQRRQSGQQNMLSNLQMRNVPALAAHLDLSGTTKANNDQVRVINAASNQGNAIGNQASATSQLYQYFQMQQPQFAVHGGFAANAGDGNVGAGSGGPATNYGSWTVATTNASQPAAVSMANLYSPAVAAQFYPGFTTPAGMNQQLYSAVASTPLSGFANSPYFATTQQQQQATAAMYGQYNAAMGNTQQQQQQNPHNI